MRRITEAGLNLTKSFEEFRATPYICPAGYPTMGYGHVIRAGETFDRPLTEDDAEELLQKDMKVAEEAVLRLIKVPLEDHQFDALVSFTFNVGSGALQRSTLRRVVNREEHEDVPEQLMRWVWAGGRKLKGLIRRRTAEACLYQGEAI